MLVHPAVAVFHHGAHCGRGRVQDVDAELLNDLPETVGLGEVGHAFEHERRRSVRQRPVHEVGMTGDPAGVGRAPENVMLFEVEHVLRGEGGVKQIAAGAMQDALRFRRAAARVEDEQGIVRFHPLRLALGRLGSKHVVPPEIAPRLHGRAFLDAAYDDAALDLGAHVKGFIADFLESQDLARTVSVV